VSRTAWLIRYRDKIREIVGADPKRRSSMVKNTKLASTLLLATFVAASIASTAMAASSANPPQIPGYDNHGNTVPIPNPDRS
jgi:hypothetical protein